MTTKLPSIPSFNGDNTHEVIAAIKEALEVRVGVRGDTLDAGVTFRDLTLLGLAERADGTTGTAGAAAEGLSSGANVRIPSGSTSPVYSPTNDLTEPPLPTDLKATAVFDTVMLSWSQPRFANPSYWEVYRSFTNDLSTAQLAGTSTSQFFSEVVGEGRTQFYWVKTVSAAGRKSAWNSSFGVEVVTGVDPAKIIAAIEGKIGDTELFQALASQISDSYDQARFTFRELKNFRTSANNQIATEVSLREAADNSLFARYTVKIDQNGHVSGFGLASETNNGTTSSAFVVRADKFAIVDPASTSNNLTNAPSADVIPFFIDGGKTYIKSAVVQDASISSAKIGSLEAKKITAGYINAAVAINGGSIYSGNFYAGGTTTISYDPSGNVTSFTPNNPTVRVEGGNVEITSDNFKIRTASDGSGSTFVPFEVVGGVVRIKNAAIGSGTITSANIADSIQSTNYDATNYTGWKLSKDGSFNLNRATMTAGVVQSTDGKFKIDLTNKTISIEV